MIQYLSQIIEFQIAAKKENFKETQTFLKDCHISITVHC